jgi:hypothetical protein
MSFFLLHLKKSSPFYRRAMTQTDEGFAIHLFSLRGIVVWFSMVAVRRDILPSFSLHPIMKDNKS